MLISQMCFRTLEIFYITLDKGGLRLFLFFRKPLHLVDKGQQQK